MFASPISPCPYSLFYYLNERFSFLSLGRENPRAIQLKNKIPQFLDWTAPSIRSNSGNSSVKANTILNKVWQTSWFADKGHEFLLVRISQTFPSPGIECQLFGLKLFRIASNEIRVEIYTDRFSSQSSMETSSFPPVRLFFFSRIHIPSSFWKILIDPER